MEHLAYDFETCGNECTKVPTAEMAGLEKNLDDMARHQVVFMKLAVEKRLRSTATSDTGQSKLIVAAGHRWELIDAVLDSDIETNGS